MTIEKPGKEEKAQEEPKDELLQALSKLGEGSKLLWTVFILTISPTLFNGFHAVNYVFYAGVPTHWCAVPQLSNAGWTDEQIKNVSSSNSCNKYNYNYTYLAQIGFDEALTYIDARAKPDTLSCTEFIYADDIDGTSIVEQWNLVCDKKAYRTNTLMALSLGKFLGAVFFGIIADKYGRKPCYAIGIMLLILSGPASAIVPWYWGFMLLRFLTGASNSAVQFSSFTILTEVAAARHRQWMGIVYSMGYPVGMMVLAGIAYLTQDWNHLQLAITVPAVFLLIHSWFMPESPRWLISQGYRKVAQRIIENYYGPVDDAPPSICIQTVSEAMKKESITTTVARNPAKRDNFLKANFASLRILFSHYELRRRIAIMYFSWMSTSLAYYAIALNVDNFSANHYVYVFLTGATELPAYLLPLPLLAFMGRRKVSALLFTISAICLLSISAIGRNNTTIIMAIGLIGRFAIASVFSVIVLHTSELFPTVTRNSVIGTCSAMSHVGSISAGYVADLLGAEAWWAPSTLCGALALIAGLFAYMLPETRGRTLAETVNEEVAKERGSVSVKNYCK